MVVWANNQYYYPNVVDLSQRPFWIAAASM